MPTINERIEPARGCGFRKPGGLYLVADGPAAICCRLPVALDVCPCCAQGIKPTRGFTWISAELLAGDCRDVLPCPLSQVVNPASGDAPRLGLLWVGEVFYPTPDAFMNEAARQGISRRIAALPRGFVVGKSWVALAHRKALNGGPAVFSLFRPTALEYVVRPTDTADYLESLERRGVTLVRVIPEGSQAPLFE